MRLLAGLLCVGTFAVATVTTGWVRRLASDRGLLDIPNARSSHTVPVPRGGGIAIVAGASLGWSVLVWLGGMAPQLFIALCGGGLAVAAVGFWDDRQPIGAGIRLAIHTAAAAWAVYWIGGLSSVQLGERVVVVGWSGYVLAVLGIVWTLNLFNFMDGIDGIAASEAVFMGGCGALIAAWGMGGGEVAVTAAVFAAACGGFLLWNWPPAKIFMGDVGSGYLGYVISVTALAATHQHPAAIWIWLMLGGVFFVDATMTLLRRLAQGEKVYVAHRSHAYQWLARRWSSHRPVTVLVIAWNLFWLLPWALVATVRPQLALVLLAIAFVPLIVAVLLAGAGRRERR